MSNKKETKFQPGPDCDSWCIGACMSAAILGQALQDTKNNSEGWSKEILRRFTIEETRIKCQNPAVLIIRREIKNYLAVNNS